LLLLLLLQMLLGLHHMHSRKVLHRDMKTLNTFLDQTLNVKLGDLGVAKVCGDTARAYALQDVRNSKNIGYTCTAAQQC
jgi:serine/threonine protein kinase